MAELKGWNIIAYRITKYAIITMSIKNKSMPPAAPPMTPKNK